ncbi:MAG: PD40 domain-containing protein [Gemmatimonadota bacterium]|nr:MAG: PD40 domain-containing protein [Gemmatimonadota bacterium]
MNKRLPILVLGVVALAGCEPEASRSSGGADVLAAAGIPGAVAASALAEQDSTPMVVRRLWYSEGNLEFWGGPSPDGRYLSYVDWSTGDLAVHDFTTGEDSHLTDEASVDDSEFAVLSAFSPDGEWIAYSWENGEYDELRVQRLDGSERRVLYSNEAMNVHPAEWSADGSEILVAIDRLGDGTKQIGLVSVAEGSLSVLKSLDRRGTFEESVSPDGRYVIYDFPASVDSHERDIHVIETATGEESVLIEHPANDLVLGWAPDGKHVFFASDRTGTLGGWLLPVANGKAAGEARLVKPELWRISPLGFARDGSYYYGIGMSMTDVYVATLDPETGQLREQPARVSQSYFGGNAFPEWSPDGRYLAYVSERSPVKGSFGSEVIVIHSMENGELRELRPKLGGLPWLSWSPDGSSILVRSSDENGRPGLFLVDVHTGDVRALTDFTADAVPTYAEWLPDGSSLVVRTGSSDGTRIGVLDLASGTEKVLYRVSWPEVIKRDFAVSPDGRQLAFAVGGSNGSGVMVMPVSGGQPRRLVGFRAGEPGGAGPVPVLINWSPDGRHVYYERLGGSETQEKKGLWRIPTAGGAPEQLDWLSEAGGILLRFHPDGRRVALTRGEGGGSEVWVMEDFLPATAGPSE